MRVRRGSSEVAARIPIPNRDPVLSHHIPFRARIRNLEAGGRSWARFGGPKNKGRKVVLGNSTRACSQSTNNFVKQCPIRTCRDILFSDRHPDSIPKTNVVSSQANV
eukprot:358500-Chlamydomonas_euryale.AAC.1